MTNKEKLEYWNDFIIYYDDLKNRNVYMKELKGMYIYEYYYKGLINKLTYDEFDKIHFIFKDGIKIFYNTK